MAGELLVGVEELMLVKASGGMAIKPAEPIVAGKEPITLALKAIETYYWCDVVEAGASRCATARTLARDWSRSSSGLRSTRTFAYACANRPRPRLIATGRTSISRELSNCDNLLHALGDGAVSRPTGRRTR
jgi:hypothetical protein